MKNIANEKNDRVPDLRAKLIQELEGREEGYVENNELVIGGRPKSVLSHIQENPPLPPYGKM